MNELRKELFKQNGKARVLRFYNIKTGKTISYKIYDNRRRYILTTDDPKYALDILNKCSYNG